MSFTNDRSYAVRVGSDVVAPGATIGADTAPSSTASDEPDVKATSRKKTPSVKGTNQSEEDDQ